MSLQQLRRVLGAAASLALFVAAGQAGAQTANDPSLTEVRAQVQAYERAWNSHDASKVAAFYTDDADMIMGNGPRITGREAILHSGGRATSPQSADAGSARFGWRPSDCSPPALCSRMYPASPQAVASTTKTCLRAGPGGPGFSSRGTAGG